MIVLREWDQHGLMVAPLGGAPVRLSVDDVLECAPAHLDGQSGQRRAAMAMASGKVGLAHVAQTGDDWHFSFDTGDSLALTSQHLMPYVIPDSPRPSIEGWRTTPVQTFHYTAYKSDDAYLLSCLQNVARFGFVLLKGASDQPGMVEEAISRFGFLRETNYGRIFDVRSTADANNLAFTSLGLEPHTDNPYRDPVPGLQLLHCLSNSGDGGETRLIDGFAAAQTLRVNAPDHFEILASTPVRFGWGDTGNSLQASKPVIELALDGSIACIRFNNRAFRSIDAPVDQRRAWRKAIVALADIINAPGSGIDLKLNPGDVLILDNSRVLHGRRSFEDSPSRVRHLQGAYADRDGLFSTLSVLASQEIDRRMNRLDALFSSSAMALNYGENLSIRAHQLQAAALAVEQGYEANIIAACLLHDIGWALPEDARGHEHSGADFLAEIFGSSVADPVRFHVMAKRFLVTEYPEYRACLSQASLDTLKAQGGYLTTDEALQFSKTSAFDAAIRVRRMDDAAKIVDKPTPDFSVYASMLKELIAQNIGSEAG